MNKLGRNDICWCGSGKKYKNCHYKREADQPIPLSELLAARKKIWTKEYCSHPSQNACSGDIVQAHTIQRRGSLERISRNGHVYTFRTDAAKIMKTGTPEINLVGISKASTFTGFCSYHDNNLFKPIEKETFTLNTETGFLLGYRVLCHELFAKKASREQMLYLKNNMDKGKPFLRQVEIQDIADQFLVGIEAGLADLTSIKSRYDELLLNHDFSVINYYAIFFENIPDFVCSGFTQPTHDFKGNQLQDLADLDTIRKILLFQLSQPARVE